MRHPLLWALVLAPAAAASVYTVHSLFKYTRMISNIFLGLKYNPVHEVLPATAGERVSILDTGGHEIEAVLVDKKGASNLVIFCHDSGSTKESWEKYAYFFPGLGYKVLSVDFVSAAGDPEKNPLSQWPSQEDTEKLVLVVRWARRAFGENVPIVLFGVSKGADIALAASYSGLPVSGVITDGLFSMREIFRDYIRKWAPILVKPNLFGENYPSWVVNTFTDLGFWYCQKQSKKKFVDVEKLLKREHVPLLMIHGESDDYIPPTHQQFLHRLDRRRKESKKLIVPKAGHNEAVMLDRDTYEKTVVQFLKKVVPIP